MIYHFLPLGMEAKDLHEQDCRAEGHRIFRTNLPNPAPKCTKIKPPKKKKEKRRIAA